MPAWQTQRFLCWVGRRANLATSGAADLTAFNACVDPRIGYERLSRDEVTALVLDWLQRHAS